jgi:type VI secretion system secreted protein VgrG
MSVRTPLPSDVLLLTGFDGTEEISTLYSFRLELLAKNEVKIDFEQLLGREMVVTMRIFEKQAEAEPPKVRYFSGICRGFSQGDSDKVFTSYQAEIVPQFWLTTRSTRSRIFQHMSVVEILEKVLRKFNVDYQLDGKFEKRDFCVQYRETDFNFLSRLMEEEGIFYYFNHTEKGSQMVIANTPRVHTDVPGAAKVRWDAMESSAREQNHVREWVRRQEVRSGKVTVWDHSFAFPGENLEASKTTVDEVKIGKVKQKLSVANNQELEIYDYPGNYAKWFDGVDKDGEDQPGELQKIFQENTRSAHLRMQAETCAGLRVHGTSNCRQFKSGHKFSLERHRDAEGNYVLVSIQHHARGGNAYRSGVEEPFVYTNQFTCIPLSLPFRPARITPKPCITGVQTATVVGPPNRRSLWTSTAG